MNILRIAWGDLRRVSKDWQALLWMLVMPLVFAFLLGAIVRGGPSRTTWIPVVDLDDSELSHLFIEQLKAEGYWIEIKESEDESRLQHGSWPCGVAIPPAFGKRILSGERAKIQLVKGNGSPEQILDAQSRLAHAMVRFIQALAREDVSRRAWDDERRDALEHTLSQPPLLSVERKGHHALRPPPVAFSQSLPGFVVMFVLLMVTASGGESLVRDRVQGQFARLMATPLDAVELYVGKVLARVLLGVIQAFLLLMCGRLLFGIHLGDSPIYLAPVILSLAAVAGCLSILVGLVCQTEKQVSHVAIFAGVFLAALGGCWWPIEYVPDAFRTVATCTPSYWAMHGLQNVMVFNKSTEVLSQECPILLAFAAGILLAVLPLRRRLNRPAFEH